MQVRNKKFRTNPFGDHLVLTLATMMARGTNAFFLRKQNNKKQF